MKTTSPDAAGPVAGEHTPNTLWTIVLAAATHDPERAGKALRQLCQVYRTTIHAWVWRLRPEQHSAADWTSEFLERLLEKNPLQHFERRPGIRFRAFLKECVRLFVLQKLRQRKADPLADRPGQVHLDDSRCEIQLPAETPEWIAQCDLDFARDTHDAALASLGRKYAKPDKRLRLQHLCLHIPDTEDTPPYREVAGLLGLSEGAVKKAVFDLRDDYFDAFREAVAHTAPCGQVDEEMRELLILLAGLPGVFTWDYVRQIVRNLSEPLTLSGMKGGWGVGGTPLEESRGTNRNGPMDGTSNRAAGERAPLS